jgi:hypothetical protein
MEQISVKKKSVMLLWNSNKPCKEIKNGIKELYLKKMVKWPQYFRGIIDMICVRIKQEKLEFCVNQLPTSFMILSITLDLTVGSGWKFMSNLLACSNLDKTFK